MQKHCNGHTIDSLSVKKEIKTLNCEEITQLNHHLFKLIPPYKVSSGLSTR
jgi:hypothetical protein